jgi:hypothetical protein
MAETVMIAFDRMRKNKKQSDTKKVFSRYFDAAMLEEKAEANENV